MKRVIAIAAGVVLGLSFPVLAARNSAGTYSLPQGPVVSGTTISSSWANPTFNDLATEISNSLDRTGRGAMVAPLKHSNGSAGSPSVTFSSEQSSGFYRSGAGDLRLSIGGADVGKWTSAGQWIKAAGSTTPRTAEARAADVVNVKDFGAKGDGTTDDRVALAAAFAATPAGGVLFFPPGTYSSSGGSQRAEPIRVIGSGSGSTVIRQTGSTGSPVALWLGGAVINFSPYPSFAGTVLDFTGNLVAGQKVLTGFASTAGLAVGDDVYLAIGQDPWDHDQRLIRHWNKITALTGTTVTVAVPLPESASGTFAAHVNGGVTWATHQLVKFTTQPDGFEVAGLTIEQSGSGVEDALVVARARNVSIRDLVIRNARSGAAVGECENVKIDGIAFSNVTTTGGTTGHGLVVYGSTNVSARNVTFSEVQTSSLYLENQNRGVIVENVKIAAGPVKNTGALIFVGGGSRRVRLRGFTLNAESLPGTPFQALRTAGEIDPADLITEDFEIVGTGVDDFPLKFHRGSIRYKGASFQRVSRFRRTVPAGPSASAQLTLPAGLYKSVRASITSKTGVTLLRLISTDTLKQSILVQPANSVDVLPATGSFGPLTSDEATTLGESFLFNEDTTGKKIEIQTDGTAPAGGSVVIEAEVFTPDDDGVQGAAFDGPLPGFLTTTQAYTLPFMANGDVTGPDVTVPGAKKGDFALASLDVGGIPTGLVATAQVVFDDLVKVTFVNHSGGIVNLGAGTLWVRVHQK